MNLPGFMRRLFRVRVVMVEMKGLARPFSLFVVFGLRDLTTPPEMVDYKQESIVQMFGPKK